jgi:hypothetical protein
MSAVSEEREEFKKGESFWSPNDAAPPSGTDKATR